MNTEEAFTPEQVTEVVGALHNATMDKWLGAGLTLVIGAVVIKIVMRALNRLVAKLPLDKAMLRLSDGGGANCDGHRARHDGGRVS